MRKFVLLFAAVVLVSVSAAAQNAATVNFAEPQPAAPASPQIGSSGTYPWQIAVGYQYGRDRLTAGPFNTGSSFTTNGLNMSFARYFGSMLGVEGQIGSGFGNTGTTTIPPNLSAKSVFFGGGPRVSWRNAHRVEPFAHAVFGLYHYRFTQTAPKYGLGSNNSFGYEFGGGADFHANDHIAFRGEVDYLGTRFFKGNQANLQIVVGAVFNF